MSTSLPSDPVRLAIEEDLKALQRDPFFITEKLLLDLNLNFLKRMEELQLSRADLARRLGWRRSAVTKLLDGNHNISIKRLVKVALAMECTLEAPEMKPLVDDNSARHPESAPWQGGNWEHFTELTPGRGVRPEKSRVRLSLAVVERPTRHDEVTWGM